MFYRVFCLFYCVRHTHGFLWGCLGYCEDWVLLAAEAVVAEIIHAVSSLLGLAHRKTPAPLAHSLQ